MAVFPSPSLRSALVVVLSASALSGCIGDPVYQDLSSLSWGTSNAGPKLPPAPLTAPDVGTRYYYSNGVTERVTAVSGDTVTWINNRRHKLVSHRDFTAPETFIETTNREYRRVFHGTPNALWPLSTGKTAKFTVVNRVKSKGAKTDTAYTQRWQCAVDGTERIRVLAGTFDTYKVTCKRFSPTFRFYQKRTWNYAPEIGHYVRRVDYYKYPGKSYTRELTAVYSILPGAPVSIRREIRRTFQEALENHKSGVPLSWRDKKSGAATTVVPILTYKAASGAFCRTYRQTVTLNGKTRLYPGVACREGRLKWVIPRLARL